MKATLLIEGKYYRREKGKLVKYKKGDVIHVSPAEARRLAVREELNISDKPEKEMTRKAVTTSKKEVKSVADSDEVKD